MRLRIGVVLVALFFLIADVATAQNTNPWRSSTPPATQQRQPATRPVQNQQPRDPYGQSTSGQPGQGYGQGYPSQNPQPQPQPGARPAREGRPVAPLQPPWWPLNPQNEKYINWVLQTWEQQGAKISMFESKFVRREFNPAWNRNKPTSEDVGTLKYKKPDKGFFEIEGAQPEKWICNGKTIFEYRHRSKELIEHRLPANLRGGNALRDGPIPFVFGAEATKMKELYWVGPMRTPADVKDQIWLEVWPRTQKHAADFKQAQIILDAKTMQPIGLRLFSPQGNGCFTSYTFYDTVVNDPLRWLKGDPFSARAPRGWTKVLAKPQANQPGRP